MTGIPLQRHLQLIAREAALEDRQDPIPLGGQQLLTNEVKKDRFVDVHVYTDPEN